MSSGSGADNLETSDCLLTTIGKSAGSQDKLGNATTTRGDSGNKSATTSVGGGDDSANGCIGERDGATNTIGSSDVLVVVIVIVVVVVASARRGGARCRSRCDNITSRVNLTLARGEVVVTASPFSLVDVTTAAATRVEVVKVLPRPSVEVTATFTLSLAEVMKADVVTGTTDPPSWVDEMTTGTNTPVCVSAAEVSSSSPVSTALVMAGGVVTIVLPESSVVVSGGGLEAEVVEDATKDVVLVLPESSVVVTATVVPPFELDPTEEDVNS